MDIPQLTLLAENIQERISREQDLFNRELLIDKLREVNQSIIRLSVRRMVEAENAARSVENTKTAPIKCGLRGHVGTAIPERDHWFWDRATNKDLLRVEKTRSQVRELLFHECDNALARKLTLLGGLKKALKTLGLSVILEIPAEARKEKSKAIIALIEKTLNGGGEVPFT